MQKNILKRTKFLSKCVFLTSSFTKKIILLLRLIHFIGIFTSIVHSGGGLFIFCFLTWYNCLNLLCLILLENRVTSLLLIWESNKQQTFFRPLVFISSYHQMFSLWLRGRNTFLKTHQIWGSTSLRETEDNLNNSLYANAKYLLTQFVFSACHWIILGYWRWSSQYGWPVLAELLPPSHHGYYTCNRWCS